MRAVPLLALLLALGCAPAAPPEERSAIGFQVVGDGYQSAPSTLSVELGRFVLRGSAPARVELVVPLPADQPAVSAVTGETLSVERGILVLPGGRELEVQRGTFTLQNLQGGLARGNFEVIARARESAPQGDKPLAGDLDVRGSFDATASGTP